MNTSFDGLQHPAWALRFAFFIQVAHAHIGGKKG